MSENKGIGVVIALLVLAIVVIFGLSYYIYTSRLNENQEIADLRAEIRTLTEQNKNYQIALDNINKTLDNLKGGRKTTEEPKAENNESTNNAVDNSNTNTH